MNRFLDHLNTLPDVYLVSASRVLEYVRNPKAGKPFEQCQETRTPTCVPKLCQLIKESNKETRWMTSCAPCPKVYPWLGNPFGLK